MRLFTPKTEQWISRTLQELFAFLSAAGNLEQLAPPRLHFRIVSSRVEMRVGARIDYQLRVHGLRVNWQSEITVWEPPFPFLDVQIRGHIVFGFTSTPLVPAMAAP